jgi:hypothetical protein
MTTTLIGCESPTIHPAWIAFVTSFSEFCQGKRDGHELEPCRREQPRMLHFDVEQLSFSRAEAYRAALLGRPV